MTRASLLMHLLVKNENRFQQKRPAFKNELLPKTEKKKKESYIPIDRADRQL